MLFQLGIPQTKKHAEDFSSSHLGGSRSVFGPLVMPSCQSRPRIFETQALPAHTTLFVQGERSPNVYFIESGVIRLVNMTPDGTPCVIGLRANGCIMDASSAVLDTPCWCTGETLTETIVHTVPASELRLALMHDDEFVRDFNEHLMREIDSVENQEAALRAGSLDERLDQLLGEFQSSLVALEKATKPVTVKQSEVASLLAITPSHLSRLVRRHACNRTANQERFFTFSKSAGSRD
jgi:CRP-like cAMP-binding protein